LNGIGPIAGGGDPELLLKKWEDLPDSMKNEAVRGYYDILRKKQSSLLLKRLFDVAAGAAVLVLALPLMLLIGMIIKVDSRGPAIFRQVRATQYGKRFKIYKFRTMVVNADKIGTQVTTNNDSRITRVGRYLRKYRLDEIPQLINIITGDMSFVGTRPEVLKYVDRYTDEMMATLLLPAGVTSEASIKYKDEEKILSNAADADRTYIETVLPEKMRYNLESLEHYSFRGDIGTMAKTISAVFRN